MACFHAELMQNLYACIINSSHWIEAQESGEGVRRGHLWLCRAAAQKLSFRASTKVPPIKSYFVSSFYRCPYIPFTKHKFSTATNCLAQLWSFGQCLLSPLLFFIFCCDYKSLEVWLWNSVSQTIAKLRSNQAYTSPKGKSHNFQVWKLWPTVRKQPG